MPHTYCDKTERRLLPARIYFLTTAASSLIRAAFDILNLSICMLIFIFKSNTLQLLLENYHKCGVSASVSPQPKIQAPAIFLTFNHCARMFFALQFGFMDSTWTTPHCGTVVEDKYIPLLLLLLSLSPQHPDWPRTVLVGSGKPPQDG